MRSPLRILPALALASCVNTSCSERGPVITAPTSPDAGGGSQHASDSSRQPSPSGPPAAVPPPEHPDRCDHRRAQWAIGHSATRDVLDRARLDAGAEFARFLRIGEPITLEYRIGRLNLGIDEGNVVRTVRCG